MFWLFTWIIVWVLWHAYTSGRRDRARRLEALARLEAERVETAYRVATGVLMANNAIQAQQAQQRETAQREAQEAQWQDQRERRLKNYYLDRADARREEARGDFDRLLNK